MVEVDDRSTTIADIRARIGRFVAERNWERYHHPKEVAISVSIEAAELLELFQWLDRDRDALRADDAFVRRAGEELADVMNYCMILADQLGIDITAAMLRKIEKNEAKYPVSKYDGEWSRPNED